MKLFKEKTDLTSALFLNKGPCLHLNNIRMFPKPIQKFIEIFSKLPSIGQRQATRLAFYLARQPELNRNLDEGLKSLLQGLKICRQCYLPFEKNGSDLCPICSNPQRKNNIICLVEKEIDAFSIEKMRQFKGTYHILGNLIDPADPKSYESLKIELLEGRIKKLANKIAEEIIIALNPTTDGDLTAMYLERRLKNLTKKITRLGRGLPTGGELEFADDETIRGAFEGRH